MSYREKWVISGVKYVSFVDENGKKVEGSLVYYHRDPYSDDEASSWSFGGVCPRKPFWCSGDLIIKLMKLLNSGTDTVFAVYTPQGRYNRVSDFEKYEEIDRSVFDDMSFDGDA